MLSTRALHIPAAVLAQPSLSLLACAVLAEILDLYQVKGQVFASDEHFAERCRCSPRKSRETIAELEAAGYLTRDVDHSRRHKRLLIPAEKWQILPGVVAESATSPPEMLGVVADSAGSSGEICQDLRQILPGVVAESANINTIVNTKGKEESSRASAATSSSSFSAEKSGKTKPTARPQKAAARAEEVAALDLPHAGPEFAQLWAEFVVMPKQVKKPVTSLRRLLATLGKYAEGFACIMLGKAIEGNWSGVEFDTTADAYAKWLAAEAERLRRQPARTNSGTNDSPELNHEFIAEVAAREQQEIDDHLARWQAKHNPLPVVDPDALFGYTQSAAEGLAQSRNTPEYQQYLAEQAADQQPDNPSDLPQDAA